MSIRFRILTGLFLFVIFGGYYLTNWILEDIRPHYMRSMEESVVDNSTLLASFLSTQNEEEPLSLQKFKIYFDAAAKRTFSAQVFNLKKTEMDLRVYVTDVRGVVVYDSDKGAAEGEDYSLWNDVHKTLRGEYGARSSTYKGQKMICVAAPVLAGETVVGVLSVCKPKKNAEFFIDVAKKKVTSMGIVAGGALLVIAVILSFVLTGPMRALTMYAQKVANGEKVTMPKLGIVNRYGSSEIAVMARSFEEMRQALEGKHYVEQYVQSLTHELKSPLSAIRGAVEILEGDVPESQRKKFIDNIDKESLRITQLVDHLLSLAALENQDALVETKPCNLSALIARECDVVRESFEKAEIVLITSVEIKIILDGDELLLRQLVHNLLINARAFTPSKGTVEISLACTVEQLILRVDDSGDGVPDYAEARVFERFYSLPHPKDKRKSSGLGLPFVQQVAQLHGGSVTLKNRPSGGCRAEVILPL